MWHVGDLSKPDDDGFHFVIFARTYTGFMKIRVLFATALPLLFLSSCGTDNTPAGGGPHATVQMRDGTAVAGTVLASSPTEIKLAGDDKITRTIPMAQVRSVDYGDTAAAAPAPVMSSPAAPPPKAAAPPSQAAAPPPSAPPVAAPDPVHDQHYHPAASEVTTKTYRLPVGTEIPVRTEETIDSAKAAEGQTFAAEVTRAIKDGDGDVVIPRGANARIIIRSSSKGGKIRGASDLVLDLDSVAIEGKQYRLSTTDLGQKGRDGVGINKRTGEFAGGGAAVGAIIGAIAGGGKAAAIGAGSGAGAGAVTQILTKGGSVKVPVESVLTFRLDRPLRVTDN
jgi:hypothetical protein